MDRIRAPYNFVPLSSKVFFPSWGAKVSQDVPFQDGICGTFKLNIEALTPLFIRGSKADQFFRTPDGKLALPGSSLRGMLRNVLEIATFGKLSRLNEHNFGIRDLHNHEMYVRHMARIQDTPRGKKEPVPLVGAGWLFKEGEEITIQPCHFAKLEYRKLMELARQRGVRNFVPGERQSSVDKYNLWGNTLRDVQISVTSLRASEHGGKILSFGIVEQLQGSTNGTLVFTGQPSRWTPEMVPRRGAGHPKHHDFVFYQPSTVKLEVGLDVFKKFEQVHSESGQQHKLAVAPNAEWGFWKKEFENGRKVPVFYLIRDNKIRAFGLAMMFRLASDFSTLTGTGNIQNRDHWKEGNRLRFDFSELLFGHVPLEEGRDKTEDCLKGRVSIGLALAQGSPKEASNPERVVLGAPRASYYPCYVEQGQDPGVNPGRKEGKPDYKSWMNSEVRIRGWKRYRALAAPIKQEAPRTSTGKEAKSDKIHTVFRPVEKGAIFHAQVRIHNLKPEELGALLWALDFGGEPGAVHLLGMARPLGYGSVRLSVGENKCFRAIDDPEEQASMPVDFAACKKLFVEKMEYWAKAEGIEGGWIGSRQMHELLTLAKPVANPEDVRSMRLDHPQWRNEFQTAKLEGLALEAAGKLTWKRGTGTTVVPATASSVRVLTVSGGRTGAALLAEYSAIRNFQLSGKSYQYFQLWKALPADDPAKLALGRKIKERVLKECPSEKKQQWFGELEGQVG